MTDFNDLEKLINFAEKFNSYEDFLKFLNIIQSFPTVEQLDQFAKSNINLEFFKILQSKGYFKLLDEIQKYHLFVTACSYDSIDIAIIILNNGVDLECLKEFALNYLIQVGGNSEYVIFRKIWEKKLLNFNQSELTECFFYVLKSSNLEFVEWFCSLNTIYLENPKIKKRIECEILENLENVHDFQIAKFICKKYLDISVP